MTPDIPEAPDAPAPPTDAAPDAPPMSKKALKRLRKKQAWDDAKDERRARRREKRHAQKHRLRAERAALIAAGADPLSFRAPPPPPSSPAPLAIVLDCAFDSYMVERERVSLASQVTRCYADNKQARHRASLWVAGFGGALAARYEGALGGQHRAWRGVHFCEGDFLEAGRRAREHMRAHAADMEVPPALLEGDGTRDELEDVEENEDPDVADVVYLTSDSPYTLDRLRRDTCYVVGGLVDKNREKGLCYRRARERGVRTARLPIGEFMVMQSRQVLATNHVVEIMLRWLECGDWGQAFLSVIPKRKGGRLKQPDGGEEDDGEEDDAQEEDDGEDEEEEEEGMGLEHEQDAQDTAI